MRDLRDHCRESMRHVAASCCRVQTLLLKRLVRLGHEVKVRIALVLLDPTLDLLQRLSLDSLVRCAIVHETSQGGSEGLSADFAVEWRPAIGDERAGELETAGSDKILVSDRRQCA